MDTLLKNVKPTGIHTMMQIIMMMVKMIVMIIYIKNAKGGY